MGTSQKSIRELNKGDVVTLAELEGSCARRYGKVVRIEKPQRSTGGRQTVIVAVQYLLEPETKLTVMKTDDWVAPPT